MALTNTQYDSIMRGYEKAQSRNTYLLDRRFKEIITNIPEYLQIDNSISSLSVSRGKRMLEGDFDAIVSLKEEIASLSAKKKQLLTKAGYPADYLDPIYDCPECKDTGFVNGEKSSLFYHFVRALREIEPAYFLFENVASMMPSILSAKETILIIAFTVSLSFSP